MTALEIASNLHLKSTTSRIALRLERDGGETILIRPAQNGLLVLVPKGTTMRAVAVSDDTWLALNQPGNASMPAHASGLREVVMWPGDALLACSLQPMNRGLYWDPPMGSPVSEMMPIIAVDEDFLPSFHEQTDVLRPPALGRKDNPIVDFLRRNPIHATQMREPPQLLSLRNLNVPVTWGSEEPTAEYLLRLLGGFQGDVVDGWATHLSAPYMQNPGYGSYYASVVGQALIRMISDDPIELRVQLARAICQAGIDLVGAWADGRTNDSNGGHMAGRRALIVASGWLLNAPWVNPSQYVPGRTREERAYWDSEMEGPPPTTPNGGPASAWFFPGWRYGLDLNNSFGRFMVRPPVEWTAQDHGQRWLANGYAGPAVGADIGIALAMRLMGLEHQYGRAAIGMARQWMQGPPAEARQALVAAGVNMPWGEAFAVSRGRGFVEAVWNRCMGGQT